MPKYLYEYKDSNVSQPGDYYLFRFDFNRTPLETQIVAVRPRPVSIFVRITGSLADGIWKDHFNGIEELKKIAFWFAIQSGEYAVDLRSDTAPAIPPSPKGIKFPPVGPLEMEIQDSAKTPPWLVRDPWSMPEAHLGKLLERLQRISSLPCIACESTSWIISTQLLEMRRYAGGAFTSGLGSATPFAMIYCDNCGHALFFSAVALGLIDPETGGFSHVEP